MALHPNETCDALVIGGGPAGLRAAEVVSMTGRSVILADRMPSVGRKFLIAGKGGLNLTHSEPLDDFITRYGEPPERWRSLLADFAPDDLCAWAKGLGIETFVGTSRRVFPVGKHATPLLRRWLERLEGAGVHFRLRHQFAGIRRLSDGSWEATFDYPSGRAILLARAVILALGGGSWPETGSDGAWTELLTREQIPVTPLAAANCGYEVDWPADFLAAVEGQPLKNVVVRAGGELVAGELLITKNGIEGGAIYQLGRVLRRMATPKITIDLKPSFSEAQLAAKLEIRGTPSIDIAAQAWRLSRVAKSLLQLRAPFISSSQLASLAKNFPLSLLGPRPLTEAISSAGGVTWESLDGNLMVKRHPGLFCAGEMIDWDAPTGGYLLQGCFATGTRAARGALQFLS